ncbi:MAG: hypothetical protein N2515_08550, partial [Deltaproteobacteria bacterium]|nr:hypothetical protein [Deltaproteobacteria bacterium]
MASFGIEKDVAAFPPLEAEALGSLSPSEHSSSPHRLHLRVEPFASMGDGTKPQGIAAIESDDGKVLDSRPIG